VTTAGRRRRSECRIATRNEATAERLPTSTHDLKIGATEQTAMQMVAVMAIAATERQNVTNCHLTMRCLEIDPETSIDAVQTQLQENRPKNEVRMVSFLRRKRIMFHVCC